MPQITKLPSFLQSSTIKPVGKPEETTEEQAENVPDDIASFYHVIKSNIHNFLENHSKVN